MWILAQISIFGYVCFLYTRGSQPGAREHHGAILISDSALFINCGSSSRHSMPVLAGENKTTVVLVDENKLRTPALNSASGISGTQEALWISLKSEER
jgi:hypothetical protein